MNQSLNNYIFALHLIKIYGWQGDSITRLIERFEKNFNNRIVLFEKEIMSKDFCFKEAEKGPI